MIPVPSAYHWRGDWRGIPYPTGAKRKVRFQRSADDTTSTCRVLPRLVLSWSPNPERSVPDPARIWDASNGALLACLDIPDGAVGSACFSACSCYVASALTKGKRSLGTEAMWTVSRSRLAGGAVLWSYGLYSFVE